METYVPLYRKYRPQQFSDLVGQGVVSTAIGNALTMNKIAHAYLFCGPRGTGKTSSARIFAKSLNCVNGPTPTPCQVCPSCIAITQGTALDVTEIDAASNNGVDNIREITDKVQFSPMQGKFKVYIIDEVHMLSTAAFNALLKTLEEPPPNVVFVFATTEPHKVLPTIISRCQRYDFSRITRQQVGEHLSHVAQLENIIIAPDAIQLIARHVKGGMRDALGLLDQVSVLGRAGDSNGIQVADVRAFIGILEEDSLLSLTNGVIEKDPQQVLGQVSVLQEKGVEPARMTQALIQHFRNLLLAQACGPNAPADDLDISPSSYEALYQQSQRFALEEIPQILSRLSTLENQLRHTPQPQLWFEVALLDITYRQDIHLIKTLSERIEALEQSLASGQVPQQAQATAARPVQPMSSPPPAASKPQSMPAQPAMAQPMSQPVVEQMAPEAVASADTTSLWHRILENVKQPTRALVKDYFSLIGIAENRITIGYSKKTMFDLFNRTADKRQLLEEAIQAVTGQTYTLVFESLEGKAIPAQPAPVVQQQTPPPQAQPLPVSQPVPQPVAAGDIHAMPEQPISPVDVGLQAELDEAKKYTQELLQGKMID